MLSRSIRKELERRQTPFYLYNMGLLRATLSKAVEASSKYGYKVHYALKANFDPELVECVREYGLGMDCVSGNEVRYAIEKGFSASSIVFAGVGKNDREITYALEQDIFAFNCESREELRVINRLAAGMGKTASVALRINPDVDPMTHRNISTGQADSKFGISYKEVDEVADEVGSLKNVNITGLHFHIGSQITDLGVFESLCQRANTLYKWFTDRGFRLMHMNMGGGLGINYNDPEAEPIPDFAGYFAVFRNNLRLHPDVEIHFELGRSIVGQCGELISRVLFVKTITEGKKVAIIDASMTELIRPALYQASHAIENLDADVSRAEEIYTIGGPVCESSDIFARGLKLPELRRGDLVTLKSAGAYGAAMASRYNMRALPEAVHYNE